MYRWDYLVISRGTSGSVQLPEALSDLIKKEWFIVANVDDQQLDNVLQPKSVDVRRWKETSLCHQVGVPRTTVASMQRSLQLTWKHRWHSHPIPSDQKVDSSSPANLFEKASHEKLGHVAYWSCGHVQLTLLFPWPSSAVLQIHSRLWRVGGHQVWR